MSLSLTFDIIDTFFYCLYCDFEQANVRWESLLSQTCCEIIFIASFRQVEIVKPRKILKANLQRKFIDCGQKWGMKLEINDHGEKSFSSINFAPSVLS